MLSIKGRQSLCHLFITSLFPSLIFSFIPYIGWFSHVLKKNAISISLDRCCLNKYIGIYTHICEYVYITYTCALIYCLVSHSICISLIFITHFYDRFYYCLYFTDRVVETQICYLPRTSKVVSGESWFEPQCPSYEKWYNNHRKIWRKITYVLSYGSQRSVA